MSICLCKTVVETDKVIRGRLYVNGLPITTHSRMTWCQHSNRYFIVIGLVLQRKRGRDVSFMINETETHKLQVLSAIQTKT